MVLVVIVDRVGILPQIEVKVTAHHCLVLVVDWLHCRGLFMTLSLLLIYVEVMVAYIELAVGPPVEHRCPVVLFSFNSQVLPIKRTVG